MKKFRADTRAGKLSFQFLKAGKPYKIGEAWTLGQIFGRAFFFTIDAVPNFTFTR